jgi:hypothetical protein
MQLPFSLTYEFTYGGRQKLPHIREASGRLRPATAEEVILWDELTAARELNVTLAARLDQALSEAVCGDECQPVMAEADAEPPRRRGPGRPPKERPDAPA